MRNTKKEKLQSDGWQIGSPRDLLGLTPEEARYVEIKVRLSLALRKMRCSRQLTQQAFADLIGSSQSRVAKMEAGDPSVSLDLLVRSLLAVGSTTAELAAAIEG